MYIIALLLVYRIYYFTQFEASKKNSSATRATAKKKPKKSSWLENNFSKVFRRYIELSRSVWVATPMHSKIS